MSLTQTKSEFLTESLIEQLNDREKVITSSDSSNVVYTNFEYEVGRKYIKVWSYLVVDGERRPGPSCHMFVEKETGRWYTNQASPNPSFKGHPVLH